MNPDDELVSLREAARRIGVSDTTIGYWVDTGRLHAEPPYPVRRGLRLVLMRDVCAVYQKRAREGRRYRKLPPSP